METQEKSTKILDNNSSGPCIVIIVRIPGGFVDSLRRMKGRLTSGFMLVGTSLCLTVEQPVLRSQITLHCVTRHCIHALKLKHLRRSEIEKIFAYSLQFERGSCRNAPERVREVELEQGIV